VVQKKECIEENRMILVTGATGTVGREVVAQLLAAGKKVRALTRSPAQARFNGRVEIAAGDLGKPETLARAVEGVESVFSLALGAEIGVQEASLAQVAKRAGVRHIVKLSVLGAAGEDRSSVANWHEAGERAIQNTGIAWTFVRPGAFMSNSLWWSDTVRTQGKIFSNFGEGRLPYIHPRDIAAVAVCALTQAGHEGKAYDLTGAEALSVRECVQILADAVGRPIEYVPITDEVAREGMEKSGMPAYLIDALLPFASCVRNGKGERVLPTVEQVTGKKPLTFVEWASECKGAFG
jgi:(4-alkanoyl-5-oxo-2,5-dihydrofuran-3-yl)methyl phosphate reductase